MALAANLSSVDTIPLNTNLPPENWVFFAVTYDGLSTANNLTFYFGNAYQEATNEVPQTYNKGVIAATGPLSIGNHNCAPGNPDAVMPGNPQGRTVTSDNGTLWRGLIDEIKIYSKVLDPDGNPWRCRNHLRCRHISCGQAQDE